VQPEKAESPISVTESGITTLVNPVRLKAPLPILLTEDGMTVD
jgi:hypothetical protein